jgi:hypothetical protein
MTMRRFYDHKFDPKSEGDWNMPGMWNRAAKKRSDERRRIILVDFDPFADRSGIGGVHAIADDLRMRRMFVLIEQCVALDWLLVTRHPQNILAMVHGNWSFETFGMKRFWPKHCFVGVQFSASCEGEERILKLAGVPAQKRVAVISPRQNMRIGAMMQSGGIGWAIVLGQSWTMHPDWVRAIRDDAALAKVPFWFDSWGCWMPTATGREFTKPRVESGIEVVTKVGRGCMIYTSCVPGEYPDAQPVERVGARRSGRVLDGKEWLEWHSNPQELPRCA